MTTGPEQQGPLGKRHSAISQITQTQEPGNYDAVQLYRILVSIYHSYVWNTEVDFPVNMCITVKWFKKKKKKDNHCEIN